MISSGGYSQQQLFPPAYSNPPTTAQTPGGEPPQTLRSLNLTRKGRIVGPLGGTRNAHNTIPRYLNNSIPTPRPDEPRPSYQPHHAQPQPGITNSNSYSRSVDWTVHASHQPATYADNNHTQGTSTAQGKFLLASSDNFEDVSLNDAMKPRG